VKIAVCIKRVPDSEARIKVGADGKAIDESGVKFVLNPYDEYAVEEALKLKEAAGAGDVVIICVGPEAAQETIRTALAMGADTGLFGKMAIDDSSHAVGPMVAELLGLPCVSAATHLEIAAGAGKAEREVEGGVEVVEFALPAVITADKGLNEPRYPALRGIMMAKKKPLEAKDAALEAGGIEVVSLTPPAERKAGRIVGEGPDAVPALVEALRNEAKVL
jgi:electron transfer flavoprotein beta subunit